MALLGLSHVATFVVDDDTSEAFGNLVYELVGNVTLSVISDAFVDDTKLTTQRPTSDLVHGVWNNSLGLVRVDQMKVKLVGNADTSSQVLPCSSTNVFCQLVEGCKYQCLKQANRRRLVLTLF